MRESTTLRRRSAPTANTKAIRCREVTMAKMETDIAIVIGLFYYLGPVLSVVLVGFLFIFYFSAFQDNKRRAKVS